MKYHKKKQIFKNVIFKTMVCALNYSYPKFPHSFRPFLHGKLIKTWSYFTLRKIEIHPHVTIQFPHPFMLVFITEHPHYSLLLSKYNEKISSAPHVHFIFLLFFLSDKHEKGKLKLLARLCIHWDLHLFHIIIINLSHFPFILDSIKGIENFLSYFWCWAAWVKERKKSLHHNLSGID